MYSSCKSAWVCILILSLLIIPNSILISEELDLKMQLKSRVVEYYNYEKAGAWEQAYVFRTPQFQKAIKKQFYINTMIVDNENWEVLDFNILDMKINGNYAVFDIKFYERIPLNFFEGQAAEKRLVLREYSVWEKIGENWFCRDPGDRLRLSLNEDLGRDRNQKEIDVQNFFKKKKPIQQKGHIYYGDH